MPNLKAEDIQHKLLKKKTAELLKRMEENNRTMNPNIASPNPIRKATARKSTHTSRNTNISNTSSSSSTAPKVVSNGVPRKLVFQRTDRFYHTPSSNKSSNKLNGMKETITSKVSSTSGAKDTKNSSNVDLIKTVQGIKGSLGLFLKAKKTCSTDKIEKTNKPETSRSSSRVQKEMSELSDSSVEDFFDGAMSDDSLPDDSPPANDASLVVGEERVTATTSEDAGSEEGLNLWLDESSQESSLTDLVAEEGEEGKVAAVSLRRLPTGVEHKLSSAGSIKVHLKKAGRYPKRRNGAGAGDEDLAPEVSIIDGIEFYSFQTEKDLNEYTIQDQKLNLTTGNDCVDESELVGFAQPIVPTKTNDITQIKGWRSKIFAAETTCDGAGNGTTKLKETRNCGWRDKPKSATNSEEGSGKRGKVREDESSEEGEKEGGLSEEREEEEMERCVDVSELPLKTYGASKMTHEQVSRFNEFYMGTKAMMQARGDPRKTKYGWYQQFGCVQVPVGAATDSAPTFTPLQPSYKYDSRGMKAILAARNKFKEPEERSLAENGLITLDIALFAVGAVRTDGAVVQPQKTVIKIDETNRVSKLNRVRVNIPKRPEVSWKSILKKVKINDARGQVKQNPVISNQQNVFETLAKRGVEVSLKPTSPPTRVVTPRVVRRNLSDSFSEMPTNNVSAPPNDYVEIAESPRRDDTADHEKPECGQSHCKLGCVCESIQVRKRKRPHCGKWDCMFGCDCGFTITSKTTGMMHKILSPSIQSCDRGETYNIPIQTDDGPVKRRRVSRPPARLMDSDFVCKSAKDLLVLPEQLRKKMHFERRNYTKFDRKVYNRPSTPTRGRKSMTNGTRSPRDEESETPRVPPIKIVNLKGDSYPKVSPVVEQEGSPRFGQKASKGPEEENINQHVLPCGTTIVSGKVKLAIPNETNARALLTMGEIGKGKSSLKFIGLRMNSNPNVMHSTEDAENINRNLTPDLAREMISMNLQQKAVSSPDKSIIDAVCAKLCGTVPGEKIIGYAVANDTLKNAVSLAKKTESPVSAPVSFTVAEFVRSEGSTETSPQFNIYPIVNCTSHVFVGPFDKILPNIFRELLQEKRKRGEKRDVEVEVREVVNDLLDCVCQVMEPQKYVRKGNVNYKVADGKLAISNEKRFRRFTIRGNEIVRKGAVNKLGRPPITSKRLRKGKSGIHPKYLPPEVVDLAHKRKLELNLERANSRNTELHRAREKSRRHSEFLQMKRLSTVLDPQSPSKYKNRYNCKRKLLANAVKCIRELEGDVVTRERVKMALINKRNNLFDYYRTLISDLPQDQRGGVIKKLTRMLQDCCQSRADRDKLQTTWDPDETRTNGINKSPTPSSDSYSSSSSDLSSKSSSESESEENSEEIVEKMDPSSEDPIGSKVQETDLIMSVDGDCEVDNETPGLFMFAEVDDEETGTITQETLIETEVQPTVTTNTAESGENAVGVHIKSVSTIPLASNVLLQFNDAASLTTLLSNPTRSINLLSNQNVPSPVMLFANQSVVNQNPGCEPKIVECRSISEAQFQHSS